MTWIYSFNLCIWLNRFSFLVHSNLLSLSWLFTYLACCCCSCCLFTKLYLTLLNFIFKKNFWSLVYLQCWASFLCTASESVKHISRVFFFFTFFFIQAITEYWVEFSVLYSGSFLPVLYSSSEYMSIPSLPHLIP